MGNTFSDKEWIEAEKCNSKNLYFYLGKIKSAPWPGKRIDQMLEWHGRYSKLEDNHSYIQWLFPIPEGSGTNWLAQRLHEEEAQEIINNKEARDRVLRAYKMMLDFYGIQLINAFDGTVGRSEMWKERFKHLNRSKHNYRRITRIIKSLGELGLERYQSPLVTFFMEEAIVHQTIPNTLQCAMGFWIEAIKDDQERDDLRATFHSLMEDGPPTRNSLGDSFDQCLEVHAPDVATTNNIDNESPDKNSVMKTVSASSESGYNGGTKASHLRVHKTCRVTTDLNQSPKGMDIEDKNEEWSAGGDVIKSDEQISFEHMSKDMTGESNLPKTEEDVLTDITDGHLTSSASSNDASTSQVNEPKRDDIEPISDINTSITGFSTPV